MLYRVYAIEKHIDRPGCPGPEGEHSLDPDEFTKFVIAVRDCEKAMEKHPDFTPAEQYARDNYRRSEIDWLRPAQRA